MAARRVRLIHWNAAEAEEKAARLRVAGYEVVYDVLNPAAMRELRNAPPDIIVVDLTRLPSQGRDVALQLRQFKATRYVPLVFVGGDQDKVERIKQLLPDAIYSTWERIRSALKQAIAHPPTGGVIPRSSFAAYVGVPLAKKLGIRANSVVALIGAPSDFEKTLGKLPDGVRVQRRGRGQCDLILWFTQSRSELESRIVEMGTRAGEDGLWIVWPKKASGIETDLSQVVVRQAGLAVGLVDYKISSIDATWAGLRFARRKAR